MVRKATGASYPAVSDAIVKGSTILLPPLEEQKRIAAILDKADAIRCKREQAIELADEFLRSLFLDMFGDPVRNPKGWPVVTLGEVSVVSGGLQVTHARVGNSLERPYLRVANVFRDRIDLTEVKKIRVTAQEVERAALRPNDLLIVEGHGNPEELGRCAVWSGQISECLHQNHLIRVRMNSESLCPEFVSAFLNSSSGRRQFLGHGKTTSGLNTISTSNVKAVRILMPAMTLQKRFLRVLAFKRSFLLSATEVKTRAEHLYQSLSHLAFRRGSLNADVSNWPGRK